MEQALQNDLLAKTVISEMLPSGQINFLFLVVGDSGECGDIVLPAAHGMNNVN
jgi:hypothetical protein